MKVIKLGNIEFLSTDNTIDVLGEKGGLFFCAYYTPSTYYQSVVFTREGELSQWSGTTKPDIILYNTEKLIKDTK